MTQFPHYDCISLFLGKIMSKNRGGDVYRLGLVNGRSLCTLLTPIYARLSLSWSSPCAWFSVQGCMVSIWGSGSIF